MAHAKARYSTGDRNIVAASHAFCAETRALQQLCQRYDTLPDHLAGAVFDRMRAAKQQALHRRPTSMIGVIALARMVRADGFNDADPLTVATLRGLLRLYRVPRAPRVSRRARSAAWLPENPAPVSAPLAFA